MKCLCVIPARGGSKRIPHKNIKEFCGKPIISYSINAALNSNVFDEVMVSTDDDTIAEVAESFGAAVPFMRSSKTSDDYATTMDVLAEVLAEYKKIGKEFDVLCCLYPCAPFITTEMLTSGIKCILDNTADSVMPVCKYPVPVEWAIDISQGEIKFRDSQAILIRSQDLKPYYYDAGLCYFSKVDKLLLEGTLTPGKTVPVVLPENQVQDIDSIEDWEFAERKYSLLS